MVKIQQIEKQNIGRRVELHPATDAWMRGDRYGQVVRTTLRAADLIDPHDSAVIVVTVKLDKSGRTARFHESNILGFID